MSVHFCFHDHMVACNIESRGTTNFPILHWQILTISGYYWSLI